jgi:hypothetical protein
MAQTRWMLDKQVYTHAYACTRTHTHLGTRTHAHTRTHTDTCNIYWFSTAPVVTRTRLNATLYVHCLSSCLSFQAFKYAADTRLTAAETCAITVEKEPRSELNLNYLAGYATDPRRFIGNHLFRIIIVSLRQYGALEVCRQKICMFGELMKWWLTYRLKWLNSTYDCFYDTFWYVGSLSWCSWYDDWVNWLAAVLMS